MTKLIKILSDISTRKIEQSNLQLAFDEVAVELLRCTKIVTPKEQFHIREIEFYFYDKDNHPDPYAHNVERQSIFGEWYFHRFKEGIIPFMKSHRNGLDITFGSKQEDTFGGILIRKIENIETKSLIEGINKVVKKLIENVGEEKIYDIAKGFGQQVFDKTQPLHLETDENNFSVPIYRIQRNGLNIDEDEENETIKKFHNIAYCYYNHTYKISQIIEVRPAL